MRRLKRTGKFFAFVRRERHAIFDSAFQDELGSMYRDTGEGKAPVPPALLATATILQAYAGVSDVEAVERATFDARWQMVLGVLGSTEPPFSQGALSAFRHRLIKYDMDRRLLERTRDFARASKGFDYKKIPKLLRVAVDSRPLRGAGRVEDTINLLGRAGRQLLVSTASIAGVELNEFADDINVDLLLESSIKAALDVDWTDAKQKSDALRQLLGALDTLETYVREMLTEHAENPPLVDHLATIARLREQDIEPEPPEGGGPRVRQGVAADRTISISDPDMRHGRKSKSRAFNGYKSHLATDLDDDVVLACAVLPANRPEREGLDAMREDIQRAIGTDLGIAELHVDRAYTNSEITQELAESGAQILSKPRPARHQFGLFNKTNFKINLRNKTATCPQGQTIPIVVGKVARFDANDCDACPLRAACTTATVGRGRSLSIAADESLQRKFTKFTRTRKGRARLRERVKIEHTLAHHSRIQGTKARYRGIRNNLFDARRTASVLNLQSAHRHLSHAA